MLPTLVLLATIASAATPEDKVLGGRIGFACTSETADQLKEAIIKAGALADQCLRRDKLDPWLGKRLESLRRKNVTTFHCNYNLSTDAAGMTGFNAAGPHVEIDENFSPSDKLSLADIRQIDMTVFHELLHAVDEDDALIGHDADLHNTAFGMPDVVYGCELACAGFIPPDRGAKAALSAYELLTETKIPELRRWRCRPGTSLEDCSFVRKYASICQNGEPFSVDKKKLARFKETTCVLHKLGECQPGKCAYKWSLDCGDDECAPVAKPYIKDIRSQSPTSWQSKATMMFELAKIIDQTRMDYDDVAETMKDPKLANQLLDIRTAAEACAKPNP
jgi:hypothetical protein